MSLPTQYLTSTRNLDSILNAIKGAQAPDKFTQSFLESLEFKSSSDRLIIGVLKALGFLDDAGRPRQKYFDFLDQTQSDRVLADGIREAYMDLFRVNVKAHEMNKTDVVNKFKTLSQGQLSESVLDKMALTFVSLVKLADFSSPPKIKEALNAGAGAPTSGETIPEQGERSDKRDDGIPERRQFEFGGLVYKIEIHLPESRDPAVYDALFRSLKEHLL